MPKHPYTMLADDGSQLPDLEATHREFKRLNELCDNTQAFLLIPDYPLEEQMELFATAVDVSDACLDWLMEQVMPTLTCPQALVYFSAEIATLRHEHAVLLDSYDACLEACERELAGD